MSWFKRSPRAKEPSKQLPHHSSPMTDKKLEEAKLKGPDKRKPPKKQGVIFN